jgi:hypothetical protein
MPDANVLFIPQQDGIDDAVLLKAARLIAEASNAWLHVSLASWS